MDAPMPVGYEEKKIINFKEYQNYGEYYLKFSYNNVNELNIFCFNIEKLDGKCYETVFNMQDIYNKDKLFRQYTDIVEIYELIIDLMNEKNCRIKNGLDNNLVFSFEISDIKRNNKTIEFILNNSNNNKDYIQILSKEIKNLRKNANNNDNYEVSQSKNDYYQKENNNIKVCYNCKTEHNLKKCICGKFYCNDCISNNINIECHSKCHLFNNNSNEMSDYYQISKFPLPKNFEAKVYFDKVDMARVGITFDPSIIDEKNFNCDSPPYNIYTIGESLRMFYTQEKNWFKYFNSKRRIKQGDSLTIRLKNGRLDYFLNGNSIGNSYIMNINEINNKEMYLLVHRRNYGTDCELKYIYELID